MPDDVEVPPDELVEPPLDDPPDEDVDPPDDEVDPPDEDVEPPDEVELPPPLVLDVLLVLVPGSVPVAGGAGSVPSVVDARSADGVPNRSLSFAPPHATRRKTDDATAALMKRLVFMRVAKH
jgi:hypothetical protein